jgi:hypothetical protein
MPARDKPDRRRLRGDSRELECWGQMFEWGHDYLGGLTPLLSEVDWKVDELGDPPRQAVKAAWTKLGSDYMRARDPADHNFPEPWAWRTFGPPPGLEGGRRRR